MAKYQKKKMAAKGVGLQFRTFLPNRIDEKPKGTAQIDEKYVFPHIDLFYM